MFTLLPPSKVDLPFVTADFFSLSISQQPKGQTTENENSWGERRRKKERDQNKFGER